MLKESKLSHYITRANALDNIEFEKKTRVAILGSFTLNGLSDTLRVKCADKKIECVTYVGGYNQYNQEILNSESKLYKFSPDITFLILDTRNILGNLFYSPYSLSILERKEFVNKRIDEFRNLIQTFTNKSKSKLVITNFNIPTHSPYGIAETKTEYGLQDMIRDMNAKLANLIINESSVHLYDLNGFVTRYGEINVFNYSQFFFGDIKIALDYIPFLANDLMSYIQTMLGMS